MEKIQITIPEGLTNEQEIELIARELGKQYLPKNKKVSIGIGYRINQINTEIEITRSPVEEMAFVFVCPVCEKNANQRKAKRLFTNYGGRIRERMCCSNDCRDFYISINPDRISKTRASLKPFSFTR